jgi:OPT family oligopeptide transporter
MSAEHAPPAALPDLAKVPEEERDRVWFDTYYQGEKIPQLTLRAVLMGMILGSVMALSNLYVGLKTGWGLGVAITACILSYAIWQVFLKIGLAKTPMTVLENNCMQSAASSAGYSTGGTMVSAIAAFVLLTGQNMPFWTLFFWTAFLAILGVAMAVPMKRQMINREQLAFPSGIAAAETLRSLHAAGEEAGKKARALFATLIGGGLVGWIIDGWPAFSTKYLGLSAEKFPGTLWPSEVELPFKLNGKEAGTYGVAMPLSPLMMAAGAIVGVRSSLSICIGGIILYAVLGPMLDAAGVFEEMHKLGALKSADASRSAVRNWGLWTGSAMMVASAMVGFAFQYKSILRAFSSLADLGKKSDKMDPLEAIEVPTSWTIGGLTVGTAGVVYIMSSQFGVSWYWGVLAVVMSFFLSLVACRVTGETDTTPIGAMGKITQLFYGVTIPGQAIPNLMTAGVTAGTASSAADLLTDLKSGYLLGANPRQQTIAQASGIISGTLMVVPVWYYVLVPNAEAIGNDKFPAPAAMVWKSVAELLAKGLDSMHPTIIKGMVIGAVVGVVFTIIETLAPRNIKAWLPSATSVGLGMVIFLPDSFAFLIGSIVAWAYTQRDPVKAETYVVPAASGIIAGMSLMGILVALLMASGLI